MGAVATCAQGGGVPDAGAGAQRGLAPAAHQRGVQPQLHDHICQLQVRPMAAILEVLTDLKAAETAAARLHDVQTIYCLSWALIVRGLMAPRYPVPGLYAT